MEWYNTHCGQYLVMLKAPGLLGSISEGPTPESSAFAGVLVNSGKFNMGLGLLSGTKWSPRIPPINTASVPGEVALPHGDHSPPRSWRVTDR